MSKLQVEIKSSLRIFRRRGTSESIASDPICTRLSIIDAACGNFTPTGALWFFQYANAEKTFNPKLLAQSLSATLNAFPHFEGRLRCAHSRDGDSGESSEAFYNRLDICYNDPRAPGVQFDTAQCQAILNDVVPTAEAQAESVVWVATDMPREDVSIMWIFSVTRSEI